VKKQTTEFDLSRFQVEKNENIPINKNGH